MFSALYLYLKLYSCFQSDLQFTKVDLPLTVSLSLFLYKCINFGHLARHDNFLQEYFSQLVLKYVSTIVLILLRYKIQLILELALS